MAKVHPVGLATPSVCDILFAFHRPQRTPIEFDRFGPAGDDGVLRDFAVSRRILEVNVHLWRTQQVARTPLGTPTTKKNNTINACSACLALILNAA